MALPNHLINYQVNRHTTHAEYARETFLSYFDIVNRDHGGYRIDLVYIDRDGAEYRSQMLHTGTFKTVKHARMVINNDTAVYDNRNEIMPIVNFQIRRNGQ